MHTQSISALIVQARDVIGYYEMVQHERSFLLLLSRCCMKAAKQFLSDAVALLCFSACAYHLADRDRPHRMEPGAMHAAPSLCGAEQSFPDSWQEKAQKLGFSRLVGLRQTTRTRLAGAFRGYEPLLLESFINPVYFRGTCYRATGWEQGGIYLRISPQQTRLLFQGQPSETDMDEVASHQLKAAGRTPRLHAALSVTAKKATPRRNCPKHIRYRQSPPQKRTAL